MKSSDINKLIDPKDFFYVITLNKLTKSSVQNEKIPFISIDAKIPKFEFDTSSENYIEPDDFLLKHKIIHKTIQIIDWKSSNYMANLIFLNKLIKQVDMSDFEPTIYKVYPDKEDSFFTFYVELSQNNYVKIDAPLKIGNETFY